MVAITIGEARGVDMLPEGAKDEAEIAGADKVVAATALGMKLVGKVDVA